MGFITCRRISSLAASLSALTAVTAVAALGLTAVPASAQVKATNCTGGSPATPVTNIGVSYSTAGNTATYKVYTLNENSSGGIPGLIAYCVATTTLPTSGAATVKGADGSNWVYNTGTGYFNFGRPDGDPSNVPLNGSTYTVGNATWAGGVPTEQIIVLHINDHSVCNPAGVVGSAGDSCWVIPVGPPMPPVISTSVSSTSIHPSGTVTDTVLLAGENGSVTGNVFFKLCPVAIQAGCSLSDPGTTFGPVSIIGDSAQYTFSGLVPKQNYCVGVQYRNDGRSLYVDTYDGAATGECFYVDPPAAAKGKRT